jgi:phosphate transport system permease protein
MLLRRKIADKTSSIWMISSLSFILVLPVIIGIALYYKSAPLIGSNALGELLTSAEWKPLSGQFGFWPFISSSLYVTFLSFVFSAPVCLLAAIYLTQFASKKLIDFMHPVIDILASLPSVIYGVWGVIIVVPFIGNHLAPFFGVSTTGYSILAGGIVLAIMCIPYMLNMLIDIFNTIPTGLKEASLSLGASIWESVKHVVLKGSIPGIFSAFGLGMAKAFGETMAVLMVVGNMINISANPFKPGYPLPALIANNYGEMLSIPMYDSALMFAALLLLLIILAINLVFRFIIYKSQLI